VDAFVGTLGARVLRGNPAAVVPLAAPREPAWMQSVAAEMNLSETAFFHPKQGSSSDFELRWFTPQCEIDLCGHATLASAHVLWESGQVGRDQSVRFHTASGVLGAKNEGESIWLNFPAQTPQEVNAPADLSLALGFSPREPVEFFRAGDDFLAQVRRGYVETLRPDFAWLRQITRQLKVRGLIVTSEKAPGEGEYDFVSRFFAPAIGIDEDPVTGSAHAALAPFWCARLGKNQLVGFQASPRGGLVQVELQNGRVQLGGCAKTAVRGELLL
jgi:PhzF family phenazine biosynthesis protein